MVEYYGHNDWRDYHLSHHGVLGMHWGIRRYQPYGHGGYDPKGNGGREIGEARYIGKKVDKGYVKKYVRDLAIDVVTLNGSKLCKDLKKIYNYKQGQKFVQENVKRLSTLKIDNKTGFRLKDKNMTADEDMKYVNPNYNNFDWGSKRNCVGSTTAFELRRRGYDVQAIDSDHGSTISDIKQWFPGSKNVSIYRSRDEKQIAKDTIKASYGQMTELAEKTEKTLIKQGNGARGNLLVDYGNGSGHSVSYSVENNKVVLRDCQANIKIRNPKEFLRYSVAVDYIRLDDVDFDSDKIKEVVK